MNKIYFSRSTCGFYPTDIIEEFPEDCVEVPFGRYRELLDNQKEGFLIIADENGTPILKEVVDPIADMLVERVWRNSELALADEELNKVQDADPKAVGTVAQWREYRRALRNYPEIEGFPNKELRPVSP